MKTLFNALGAMQKSNAEKMLLIADKPTQVFINGQAHSAPVISAADLQEMVVGSAPENLHENLKSGWPVQYDILQGDTTFNVSVASVDGVLQVECTPKTQTAQLQTTPNAPLAPAHVANIVTPTIMCSVHPERPAAGVCAYSGKFYSQEELVLVDGKQYGRENLSRVMAEVKESASKSNTPSPMVFMNAGGGSSSSSAAAVSNAPVAPTVSPYSKNTAIMCCLAGLVGLCGIHRVYTGQVPSGVMQFFTVGGLWIWQFLDLLALFNGTFRDGNGLLVTN